MNKAITTFTVIGKVTHEPSHHTSRGSEKPYMILKVLNDESNGGRFEFYCGTEWVMKKLADVHPNTIVCVKGRLGVNVNSGTNGGEFHNVNITAEDVVIVGDTSTSSQPAPDDTEPF